MLTRHNEAVRFLIGLGVTLAILVAAFTIFNFWIQTRGALPAELAASYYPGDELVADPDLLWMHGISIQAPPEKVWPWLIQIGDTRGGFYSYTFIENLVAGEKLYRNADQVNPDWQTPFLGQAIIADYIRIWDYQNSSYVLAKDELPFDGFDWTWLWWVYPSEDGQATRLVVRHRIQAPGNGALLTAVNLSGFVMEWRMLLGIRDRAEGRPVPNYLQGIEIILWVVALVQGLIGAVLFITHPHWQAPLAVGIAALLILLIFTFIQPALWLRLLIDTILLAGLRLAYQGYKPQRGEHG